MIYHFKMLNFITKPISKHSKSFLCRLPTKPTKEDIQNFLDYDCGHYSKLFDPKNKITELLAEDSAKKRVQLTRRNKLYQKPTLEVVGSIKRKIKLYQDEIAELEKPLIERMWVVYTKGTGRFRIEPMRGVKARVGILKHYISQLEKTLNKPFEKQMRIFGEEDRTLLQMSEPEPETVRTYIQIPQWKLDMFDVMYEISQFEEEIEVGVIVADNGRQANMISRMIGLFPNLVQVWSKDTVMFYAKKNKNSKKLASHINANKDTLFNIYHQDRVSIEEMHERRVHAMGRD